MRFDVLGAVSAAIAVAAGAFGAHGLRDKLEPSMLSAFETGARYQFFHALAMILVALANDRRPARGFPVAGVLFAVGTVLFSGSLYTLALTGVRAWGAVTPFGGLCFITGWLVFAVASAGKGVGKSST
jgi:uncharacterized membrane protein YgdD (TMEM256/DUF423 family)